MHHGHHLPQEEEQKVDITPMLDVVFILLIFFIVTATFVDEVGIEVNRPEANTSTTQEESRNILVKIGANDEVWIDDRQVDLRAVRPNIIRRHAENPDALVLIQAIPGSRTSTLVSVMDATRMAGIFKVSIVGQGSNG